MYMNIFDNWFEFVRMTVTDSYLYVYICTP
jgi:hypothetical protein